MVSNVRRSFSRGSSGQQPGEDTVEHERVRTAVVIVLVSASMAAGGWLLLGDGGLVSLLAGILIAFGVMGLLQAVAISFGLLTPRSDTDYREDD